MGRQAEGRKAIVAGAEWFAATRQEWDRVNSIAVAKATRELNGVSEEAAL